MIGGVILRSDELRNAKKNKNDEFYTQLSDIEKEMRHYKDFFEDKVVYCNCDDPFESNFFKYFATHFNTLKLKKLISVSYAHSPIAGEEVNLFENQGKEYKITGKRAYKVTISELQDVNNDGREDLEDVQEIIKHRIRYLKGDGDFRSEESIELLKEADIVCTNPPFSLFRDFVAQLMEYDKKFIIIGNVNSIAFKEFFPLIKDNKVWMSASIHSADREFRVPETYPLNAAGTRVDEEGRKYIRVKGVRWFTNLDYVERHEDIDLYKKYTAEEYPQYVNYDAIEVSKTADIPYDYYGKMGVPITFLDKFNPEQFDIIGFSLSLANKMSEVPDVADGTYSKGGPAFYLKQVNGKYDYKRLYFRVVIRRKKDVSDED